MDDITDTTASRLAPLLAPLEGSDPVGPRPDFDPDFGVVQSELQKLESVALGGLDQVRWGAVVESGGRVLTLRAKDLRVASYLAMALFVREAYAGLAVGMTLVEQLLDRYGLTLQPKRPKALMGVVTWLLTRTEHHMRGLRVVPGDLAPLRELEATLARLWEFYKLVPENIVPPRAEHDALVNLVMQRVWEAEEAGEQPHGEAAAAPERGVGTVAMGPDRALTFVVRAWGTHDLRGEARFVVAPEDEGYGYLRTLYRLNNPGDQATLEQFRVSAAAPEEPV